MTFEENRLLKMVLWVAFDFASIAQVKTIRARMKEDNIDPELLNLFKQYF